MENNINIQTGKQATDLKYSRELIERFISTWQALKVNLWLCYFIGLEWIAGNPKEKENPPASIGLS